MPKKQPKNSFYFFMKDLQEEWARDGQRISMANMSVIAGPRWNAMSEAEKAIYEIRANEWKNNRCRPGKLASDGTSIAKNKSEERKALEKEEIKKKQIQNKIMELKELGSVEAIAAEKFYVCTCNVFCKFEDKYFPAEIGISEYSLQDGVSRVYHKFIDPGPIPIGCKFEAKSHSEETHNIPLPCGENAQKNYRELYEEVLEFITPPNEVKSNSPIYVFCLKKDIDQNKKCFKWLHYKAGKREDMRIAVHDITVLLMEVRAQVDKPYHSYALASEDLHKNTFDYTPDTRCPFHEDLDSVFCALAYTKRVCYLFSDSACGFYNVEVTEKHLPKQIDNIYACYQPLHEPFSDYGGHFIQKKQYEVPQDNKLDMESLSLSCNKTETEFDVSSNASSNTSSKYRRHTPSVEMRQPRSSSVAQKLFMLKNASALTQGMGIGRGRVLNVPSTPAKPGQL